MSGIFSATRARSKGLFPEHIVPLKRPWPRRLRARMLILVALSLAVILGIVSVAYTYVLTDWVSEQYIHHGSAMVTALSSVEYSAQDIRGPVMQEQVHRLKGLHPDIESIDFYAPVDGYMFRVASTDHDDVWNLAAGDIPADLQKPGMLYREQNEGGVLLGEFWSVLSIEGRKEAAVRVRYLATERHRLLKRLTMTFWGVGSLGALILLFTLYGMLDSILLKPLVSLRKQADAIKGGYLYHRTGLKREDELGELARDMDSMAASLYERESENTKLKEELEKRFADAESRSVTDYLTSMYNHRYFQQRLSEEIERALRYGSPLSVLFCDIDHFKQVNDNHGHLRADEVLKSVALLICGAIRTSDIAARYGGEEFTVILPQADSSTAEKVAERIRQGVAGHTFTTGRDTQLSVTVSIGVASLNFDGKTVQELVQAADQAMYYAKRLGRNQVRRADEMRHPPSSLSGEDSPLDANFMQAMGSLVTAVDQRDHYTYQHSVRVSSLAVTLAKTLGLKEPELSHIRLAGLLHDVGKIGVPDHILQKKGPLTEDEWEMMKEHPTLTKATLQHMDNLRDVVPIAVSHHELWNGKGYPSGLKGNEIPLGARILSVVDAYDAMTSHRPYRQPLPTKTVLAELHRWSGIQFDPHIVKVFISLITTYEDGHGAGPAFNNDFALHETERVNGAGSWAAPEES